jgi:curved DNA-binding protein CbpA
MKNTTLNRKRACRILGLPQNFTTEQLKRQYHINALRYHPDKNKNREDTTEQFQEINAAYMYLTDNYGDEADKDERKANVFDFMNYDNIFECFVKLLVKNKFSTKILLELDIDILDKIYGYLDEKEVTSCNNENTKTKQDGETEDDRTCYFEDFISRTKQEIKKIIEERRKNIEILLIEPELEDLLNQKVFKLNHTGENYYVPLWHSEMYYKDSSNNQFVVRCKPVLDEYIDIDEYNNIHVKVRSEIRKILSLREIEVRLGSQTKRIPSHKLSIKSFQEYRIKQAGIPKINPENCLDNTVLSDIIVYIELY